MQHQGVSVQVGWTVELLECMFEAVWEGYQDSLAVYEWREGLPGQKGDPCLQRTTVHFGANNSTNAVISADICPYKDAQRCSHHTSSEAKAVRCTTSSCDGHNDCHDERWGWLPDEWWDRLPGCTTRSAGQLPAPLFCLGPHTVTRCGIHLGTLRFLPFIFFGGHISEALFCASHVGVVRVPHQLHRTQLRVRPTRSLLRSMPRSRSPSHPGASMSSDLIILT